jgi:hypothetical protein
MVKEGGMKALSIVLLFLDVGLSRYRTERYSHFFPLFISALLYFFISLVMFKYLFQFRQFNCLQIKDLSSQLAAEKAARAELERQLKEAENKIAQLQEALKAEKATVANLQDANADLKQEIATHERKIANLESELGKPTQFFFFFELIPHFYEVKEFTVALSYEISPSLFPYPSSPF